MRTVLDSPPKDLDTLGVLNRGDLDLQGAPLQQATQASFKGLRKASRLLIRHACNIRRLKYGKEEA